MLHLLQMLQGKSSHFLRQNIINASSTNEKLKSFKKLAEFFCNTNYFYNFVLGVHHLGFQQIYSNTNMTIDEIKNKMRIPADASPDYIKQTFAEIAEVLKSGCVIKFENEEYRILDFEFYFYNKNHQDISVHPRNSEALCWYINDFGGIDLNFESKIKKEIKGKTWSYKYVLTDDSFFGGILIRQIQRLSDKMVFDGPWKVADLFRIIDATSQIQNNPILLLKQLVPIKFKEPQIRYNLLGSHKGNSKAKADYNLKECFTDVSDSLKQTLEDKLSSFCECTYRYCWIP